MRIRTLTLVLAMCAATVLGDAVKDLNDAGAALLKEKKYFAAGEKFLEAVAAQTKEPRQLAGGFEQVLRKLNADKDTNVVAQAETLGLQALAIPGLQSKSRIRIQQLRIATLAALGRKPEALALAQDMLDAHLDFVNTASAGADAAQTGKPGRDERFAYLERILNNPGRYGLEGQELRRLIGEYAGERRAWGGDVIERGVLEKAEAYTEKYGLEKWTPLRLAEMREMDKFPLSEEELHIPAGLRDFGIDPNRKVVHARDFGWNPTNATECLTAALNSDASTVIVDDMGSPWYIRQIKISKKDGSNKQIIFKKGVKIHAVLQPAFVKGSLFELQDVTNIVFIGEGELGKDVYIGQFPDRASRFASGISYGGSGFGGKGRNVLLKNIWSANNLDDGFCMGGGHHYLVDCLLDDNYRQGLSIVWSDNCVYKNVTFCRTVGGEPHNGVDLEPVYEVYSSPAHYFLNCRFFDNAAGNVVLSSSTYAPTTLYFKDCEFDAGRYRNLSILARLGIYTGPVQKAPSRIIFENCRIDGHADSSALFWNTMIFDMWFKNCVFNDKGHLDPTRKPNMSPIFLNLDRGYWDGFYPKPGIVTFENCTFNGWEGKPLIAVADHNGKLGINSFRGVVDHNGQKVDLSKFSYLPAERSLKDAPDPDLKTLDIASAATSCEPAFGFDHGAPWYHSMPTYIYYLKGKKGAKATLNFSGSGKYEAWTLHLRTPSGAESIIGTIKNGNNAFEIAFTETGVHEVYGTFKGDESGHCPMYQFTGAQGTPVAYAAVKSEVGRRLQLKTAADKPRAAGYFEVAGGQPVHIKLSQGGLEILDESGASLIKLDDGDYFGTKTFTLKPKQDAIWSFRALTPSVNFRFFAPYAGIIATTPEALPTTKKGLAFTLVTPVPAPEIKDEPALPLPEKYAEEVAKLVEERAAWAKLGNEAKRLAEAEASLARLRQHNDGGDGARREIDDVTRTVERMRHRAAGEAQALKETPEEAKLAVMLQKYGTAVIPEMMWACPLKDGILTYPDFRTLKAYYNEIIRRQE